MLSKVERLRPAGATSRSFSNQRVSPKPHGDFVKGQILSPQVAGGASIWQLWPSQWSGRCQPGHSGHLGNCCPDPLDRGSDPWGPDRSLHFRGFADIEVENHWPNRERWHIEQLATLLDLGLQSWEFCKGQEGRVLCQGVLNKWQTGRGVQTSHISESQAVTGGQCAGSRTRRTSEPRVTATGERLGVQRRHTGLMGLGEQQPSSQSPRKPFEGSQTWE